VQVEKFLVRKLGDLIRVWRGTLDRLMKANSHTMSRYADEKSDEGIRPMKQPNKEGAPSTEAVGKALARGERRPDGRGPDFLGLVQAQRQAAQKSRACTTSRLL
jgi:hypothetical protein